MRLSAEQHAILDTLLAPLSEGEREHQGGRLLNVPAIAGAGKSVLIAEIARRSSDRRLLFLSHGRNVADRARVTLPPSCTVRTVYEHAQQFLRHTHEDKLRQQRTQPGLSDADIKAIAGDCAARTLGRVKRVLAHFYESDNRYPEPANLPTTVGPNEPDWLSSPGETRHVLAVARDVWFSQCNSTPGTAPLTFQAVIKLWTQAIPVTVNLPEIDRRITLSPLGNHDLVVVEEAQDASVALLSMLVRQRVDVLLFGDAFQALRRGNPELQRLRHPLLGRGQTLSLFTSYRFGASVASLLNAILAKGNDNRSALIRGEGRSAVHGEAQRSAWESQGEHFTLIARSPVTLFQEALDASERGLTLAWVDGLASYPVDQLHDLALLARQNDPVHRAANGSRRFRTSWIGNLGTLDNARQYYERRQDAFGRDLSHLLLAQPPGRDVLTLLAGWERDDALRQEAMLGRWDQPPHRDITLTTVTRAKGNEFPRVVVANDLVPSRLVNRWALPDGARLDLNYLYTALSRTQFEVSVPGRLLTHLDAAGWALADNDDVINLVEDALVTPHPYFGSHRYNLLEMSPRNRGRRKRQRAPQQRSTRVSGQDQIRARIEEEARQSVAKGPAALREALGHGPVEKP